MGCTVTSLHRTECGQGSKWCGRSLADTFSASWSGLAPTGISHTQAAPLMRWMRMAPHLSGLLTTCNLSLVRKKKTPQTAVKPKLRDILRNTWLVVFKTVKVIKIKKVRNSQMRGSQGAITTNCSGVGSWKRKRTKKDVKSKESVAFS